MKNSSVQWKHCIIVFLIELNASIRKFVSQYLILGIECLKHSNLQKNPRYAIKMQQISNWGRVQIRLYQWKSFRYIETRKKGSSIRFRKITKNDQESKERSVHFMTRFIPKSTAIIGPHNNEHELPIKDINHKSQLWVVAMSLKSFIALNCWLIQ